jgi:hypothetical protein
MILYHRVSGKSVGAYVVSKETACFSDEHLYFDTLNCRLGSVLVYMTCEYLKACNIIFEDPAKLIFHYTFSEKKYIYCLTKVKVDNITLRLVLAFKLRHTKKFKLIILIFTGKWRSGRSNNNLRSYCRLWLGKVRLQKFLRNLYRLAFL